jgi:hypothetical protein
MFQMLTFHKDDISIDLMVRLWQRLPLKNHVALVHYHGQYIPYIMIQKMYFHQNSSYNIL